MTTYLKNIILFTADINSESVYNKNYLKTKIKSHGDEVTDFRNKKILSQTHTCLAVVSLDSPLKKDNKYNLQVFLKEYKYIEKNVVRHIHNNLSDFSSSSSSSSSDESYEEQLSG